LLARGFWGEKVDTSTPSPQNRSSQLPLFFSLTLKF